MLKGLTEIKQLLLTVKLGAAIWWFEINDLSKYMEFHFTCTMAMTFFVLLSVWVVDLAVPIGGNGVHWSCAVICSKMDQISTISRAGEAAVFCCIPAPFLSWWQLCPPPAPCTPQRFCSRPAGRWREWCPVQGYCCCNLVTPSSRASHSGRRRLPRPHSQYCC